MTHAELVQRAERWLRSTAGCQCVVTAAAWVCTEQPDAIGWTALGFSTLIECKATRKDFRRDVQKWHRAGVGLGNRRYYMTPPDLVTPDEVPHGWGLLWCQPRTVRVVLDVEFRSDRNWMEEMKHLLAQIRRVKAG